MKPAGNATRAVSRRTSIGPFPCATGWRIVRSVNDSPSFALSVRWKTRTERLSASGFPSSACALTVVGWRISETRRNAPASAPSASVQLSVRGVETRSVCARVSSTVSPVSPRHTPFAVVFRRSPASPFGAAAPASESTWSIPSGARSTALPTPVRSPSEQTGSGNECGRFTGGRSTSVRGTVTHTLCRAGRTSPRRNMRMEIFSPKSANGSLHVSKGFELKFRAPRLAAPSA